MHDAQGQSPGDLQALRASATVWIDAVLNAYGINRLKEVEVVKVRPWSTVMSVATSDGTTWFKAASPATSFEIRLYPVLTSIAPEIVLHPLASDEDRGWILLPDGGDHLDSRVDEDGLVDALAKVMPRYAEMQRRLVSHVDALLAAGVPDMQPNILPRRFDEVLVSAREFVATRGTDEHRELLEQVETLREPFNRWCLAAAGLNGGASLDHNDLHGRNILIPRGMGISAARVYDWGDSVVAHPFTTLLVLLRYLQNELDAVHNDPRLLRVRDAYLEVFDDLGTHDELVDMAMDICQVGKVTRAHGWMRALAQDTADVDPDFASAPLEWLGELRSRRLLDTD